MFNGRTSSYCWPWHFEPHQKGASMHNIVIVVSAEIAQLGER